MVAFAPRSLLFGFLSWLIPFAVSIPFHDRKGELLIAQPLFKSLMVVTAGGVAALLLLALQRRISLDRISGLQIGLAWLAINLVLDLVVLVPMARMTLSGYLQDIGLRYLLIPIFTTAMGAAASASKPRP